MVDSISSSSIASIIQSVTSSDGDSSSSLTDSQLETISSVLAEYDSSNISESDAQSIVSAFEEAGIEPSEDLASAMEEAGFSAQEVGSLAHSSEAGAMPPPPPPPASEDIDTVSSLLDSLLSTEEDEESDSITATSIDDVMDYTSRILSLNDESKTEVMSLLEEYSSSDTEYTQEETATLIKNSLSSILGNSDNYKSVSFYG